MSPIGGVMAAIHAATANKKVAAPKYSISGNVGVAGATIALGDKSAVSGADGTYTIEDIPAGMSGALTPTLAGYQFTPATISITAMTVNLTGKDYVSLKALLFETLTGSGALTSHTPDIVPVGSAWSVKHGTFGSLFGGKLSYTTGTYGVAIIDVGVADFELIGTMKMTGGNTCFVMRSDADGLARVTIDMSYSNGKINLFHYSNFTTVDVNLLSSNIYGTGSAYGWPTIQNNEEHTLRVLACGPDWHMYFDGTPLSWAINAALLTGNQVGFGVVNSPGADSWNQLAIYPSTGWKKVSIIGDSISAPTNLATWVYYWSLLSNNGKIHIQNNNAVAGYSVGTNMAGAATAASDDGQDETIILLGTNDGNADFTATYEAQLEALWAATSKPIICLGPLDKTTDAYAANERTRVQNAVATAVAAGVNATYVNTAGWITPATDCSEGLHPNATGKIKVANALYALLG